MRVNKKDRWQTKIMCLVGLVVVLGLSGFCEAVTPKIWEENLQDVFEKGETEGLALTRDGLATLGPQWNSVADTQENFVWSLAFDAKGTIYIGTGVDGRVYTLKSGSKTPTLIFDAEEATEIYSLAIGPRGALYAGTSPNGLIYRITEGKPAEVFCKTGDLHVWALLWQGEKLYAATGGEQGRILKVTKNKAEVVYKSNDPNVISLATAKEGTLYAGTDQNGLIYKVSPKGSVSVLYDTGKKEVHDLVVGNDGTIYAAAMPGQSEEKQNGNGEGAKSVLYAIRPSGSALRLWETDDPLLLSVSVDSDGSLRVVTGKKGRVYRIWTDGTYALLAQLEDIHPRVILPTSDGALWVGSSGDGKLFKLSDNYVSKGSFTSEVKDFTLVSHWGQVHWQGMQPSGTSFVLMSRSGNSETPDDTWSSWSSGVKKSGDVITSHPARFLQYRLHLTSSSGQVTPQVRTVRLAGLQENIAPMVLSVKVTKDDENGDRQRDRRSFWKVAWEAGDVNDDQLFYTLSFREVGTSRWLLLKEDFRSGHYVWDTETVPDGRVQVRVEASDRGSNPSVKALSGEAVSAPFQIDNTPPSVKIQDVRQLGMGKVAVMGAIEDFTSAIASAKYAVNSGEWQVIFPEDALFDSAQEKLHFEIGDLKIGAYVLVIQAEDVLGNVGVSKIMFEVK